METLLSGLQIRPLLGRKACLGTKIVAYLDNDHLNKPNTAEAEVYLVHNGESPVAKERAAPQRIPRGILGRSGSTGGGVSHTPWPSSRASAACPMESSSGNEKPSAEDLG